MSQSQKHHFLPVFYLKGFASENEQFKIFNVKTEEFKQKGKLFSPSSHFYILKDNTIMTDFGEDDFMEKFYEKVDNSTAKIFQVINSNTFENRFGVSETDMPYLNNFVSQTYWRSPFNKNILQDYIKKYKLKELGLTIIDENGNHNEELSEKYKNEPEFYKTYKLYNSLLDSIRGFNCRTQYHIFGRPRELPSICSDSPIIFSKSNDIKVYEDDYIFPISKSRIFMKRNLTQKFNHQLHHLIDLILLKQSINYLATSDESYVYFLMELDKENNYSLNEYKEILFNNLV
ncbi:DUF4238 domain-containing protein [Chryseobacterium sp. SIMBA_029]|uniref:DUF4238 domain-containing protein n=2 Tax=Bacteria TaxID=2 RepID=UPI00397DC319